MTRVVDAFTRTVASGWGNTPSGLSWALWGGSPSDRGVTSGAGRVTLTGSSSTIRGQLIERAWGDGEVLAHMRVGQVSETESVMGGVLLRYGETSYYRVRVIFTTTGGVQMDVTRGTSQVGDRVTTGVTYGAGGRVRVRARVDGHRVRARVWPTAGAEPSVWQVDRTIPVADRVSSGWMGVFASSFGSNTNIDPWVEFERVELAYGLLVENTLSGAGGQQVTNARLVESAQAGTVTIQASGSRAVYDTTHTIHSRPTVRLNSGHHRAETPRLRANLPASGAWCARWYVWVPRLQDAGHGTGEVRTAAVWPSSGRSWVVHATAAGNIGTRVQEPDLAAPAIQWDVEAGSAVATGQMWRVELRYSGGNLTSRVYAGHNTAGFREHVWEGFPDPGRILDVTGYRWNRGRPLLMWGDQGSAVATLQNELIDLGYDLSPWGADGDFGEGTHNVVMQFQAARGITPVDGAAGPETRAAIDMARGLTPPSLWVSHLAVSDGVWVGPAEPPPPPVEVVRRGFTVGIPI